MRGIAPSGRSRRLAVYPRRHWRALALTIALSAAASVMAALQPLPLKLLVDHALGAAPLPGWLSALLGRMSVSATPPWLVAAAAMATTIGVVRFPGRPPIECLSRTRGLCQLSRSPTSTITFVRAAVSRSSNGRAGNPGPGR